MGNGEETIEETIAGPAALGNSPSELYTWEAAAAYLGVRYDDLAALLPDISYVVNEQPFRGFTPEEMGALEQLVRRIHQFAAESVYSGGDL